MTEVRKALRQRGVSPKLVADLLGSIFAFALLALFGFDVDKDPVLMAALAKGAGFLAGVIVGPGTVEVERSGPASSDPVQPNLEF